MTLTMADFKNMTMAMAIEDALAAIGVKPWAFYTANPNVLEVWVRRSLTPLERKQAHQATEPYRTIGTLVTFVTVIEGSVN